MVECRESNNRPTHYCQWLNAKMLSSWSHSLLPGCRKIILSYYHWASHYFCGAYCHPICFCSCYYSPRILCYHSILSLGFVFSPQVVGQIFPLFQTLIGLETSVIDYPQPMMPRHIETVGMGHGYGRNTNFTNKKWCILYQIWCDTMRNPFLSIRASQSTTRFCIFLGSALSRVSLLYFAHATCVTADIVLSLTQLSIYSGFVGYCRFGVFSSQ